MAELRPYPLAGLIRRMTRELYGEHSLFGLPERKFVLSPAGRDWSVRFHQQTAATPFGPAAGPHSQLAQNIVLSWLAGGRIIELKTVQQNDRLTIPRPCIDMQTVGYNVEWSQELRLHESLEEYVKASMLIDILVASKKLDMPPGFERTIFDMSVGYDLAGIRSEAVVAFIRGMMDARPIVDRLRRQIPDELRAYRDLDFSTRLSRTLTLSTFHGCPPDEIERIIEFLLEEVGLHCVVKLNPMLLGAPTTRHLLNEQLGYRDIRVPDHAFARDTGWEQAVAFCERLKDKAAGLDLGFGIKLTNTLVVENHRAFFPGTEKEMYLSGAPLHVLAMNLVGRFRQQFGDRFPISFSAGIDHKNFADAVAIGLVPVTVSSDLLKPGGYGRPSGYFQELERRMDSVSARDIDEFVLRAYGHERAALARLDPAAPERTRIEAALDARSDLRAAAGDALFCRWVREAKLLNTEAYVARATQDPRYAHEKNNKAPKKIGRQLVLLDCITCDKCIPVCPNDANFSFVLPCGEVPVTKLKKIGDRWERTSTGVLRIDEKHQIGNFADFCNDCGNCDVFCPEDGGPYVVKPRFFGRRSDWAEMRHLDGFYVQSFQNGRTHVLGRFAGLDFELETRGDRVEFRGPGFDVRFSAHDPEDTLVGEATGEVDLTYFHIMNLVHAAIVDPSKVNYVGILATSEATTAPVP